VTTTQVDLAVGGVTIAGRAAGRPGGPPLVLLHGLSANASSWQPVVDRIGSTWRTYALDFRGHGTSAHTPGGYTLDDYRADAVALLDMVGEPAVVVGHSLGSIVAATLAQEGHPLVDAIVLEDPPLFCVERAEFARTSFARVFPVLHDHVARLQADGAPVDTYRALLAASPHPAGGTQGERLEPDALWARAEALSQMDPDAFTAVLDGRTFDGVEPDRPIACPVLVLAADPACDPAFRPRDEQRLWACTPHADVECVAGAAHNIRGDRAGRARYLDLVARYLERVAGAVAVTR
jgi:pimeloyl-ACP methyl ester carboxylesterase